MDQIFRIIGRRLFPTLLSALTVIVMAGQAYPQSIATTLNSISGPPGWYCISFPFASLDRINGWDGQMYHFEGSSYSKRSSGSTGFVRPGQGYWIYSRDALRLTVEGDLNESSAVHVRLSAGWNMIGNPFPSYFQWSSALVSYSGMRVDVVNAENRSWLISTLLGYDPVSRSYHRVGPMDRMEPWKGYWLYSSVACDLVLPNPSRTGVASTVSITVDPPRIPADGRTKARVKVKVLDSQNKPVPYQMVKFTSSLGRVTPEKMATDGGGEASAYVSSRDKGSGSITAQAGRGYGSASIAYLYQPIGIGSTGQKGTLNIIGKLPLNFCGTGDGIALDDGEVRLFCGVAKKIISARTHNGYDITVEHPVLEASDDEGLMGSPHVVRVGTRWRMYYDEMVRHGEDKSWIHSAISDDGKTWRKEGICFSSPSGNEFACSPSVIYTKDSRWRLFYSNASGSTFSAISSDGRNFTPEEGARMRGIGFDAKQLLNGTYFAVFERMSPGGKPELWSATSDDGLTWKDNGLLIQTDEEAEKIMDAFVVVFPDGSIKVYFIRVGMDNITQLMCGEYNN